MESERGRERERVNEATKRTTQQKKIVRTQNNCFVVHTQWNSEYVVSLWNEFNLPSKNSVCARTHKRQPPVNVMELWTVNLVSIFVGYIIHCINARTGLIEFEMIFFHALSLLFVRIATAYNGPKRMSLALELRCVHSFHSRFAILSFIGFFFVLFSLLKSQSFSLASILFYRVASVVYLHGSICHYNVVVFVVIFLMCRE